MPSISDETALDIAQEVFEAAKKYIDSGLIRNLKKSKAMLGKCSRRRIQWRAAAKEISNNSILFITNNNFKQD
jgi:hypothetical protein